MSAQIYSDGRRQFSIGELDDLRLMVAHDTPWETIARMLRRTVATCRVTASVHGWRRPGSEGSPRGTPRRIDRAALGEPIGLSMPPDYGAAQVCDNQHVDACLAQGGFERREMIDGRAFSFWPNKPPKVTLGHHA